MNNSKYGGRTAILNLQATKIGKRADLVIHSYADTIFDKLIKRLGIEEIPDFNPAVDPTKSSNKSTWNIDPQEVKRFEQLYKNLKSCSTKKHKADDHKHCFNNKKIKSE